MGLASFVGYVLLGMSPAIAMFLLFVSNKSLLILTTLASTFCWLLTLLVSAAPWRAWDPLPESPWVSAALVTSGIVVQELARPLLYWGAVRVCKELDQLAVKLQSPPLTIEDHLQVWFAIGLGHGISHSVFGFLSSATLALGPGTLYLRACPGLPYFAAAGLTSTAFVVINTFLMLVFCDGCDRGSRAHIWAVPVIHLACGLLTVFNTIEGACMFTIPILHIVSLGMAGWAAHTFLMLCSDAEPGRNL